MNTNTPTRPCPNLRICSPVRRWFPDVTLKIVLLTIGPSAPERPKWLRAPAPVGQNYRELKNLIADLNLHTVCESAACPNVGECWNHRTATFMILGNVCTRRCGFCAVQKGGPLPVDYDEPRRVAEAVAVMGLRYAVVTSVNRDDRKDGGAVAYFRARQPAKSVWFHSGLRDPTPGASDPVIGGSATIKP